MNRFHRGQTCKLGLVCRSQSWRTRYSTSVPPGHVALVRHAYIATTIQRTGVGTRLLRHVQKLAEKPILIGTWADASWAIEFYRRYGFTVISNSDKERLLRTYWSIPPRQIETSVVLADTTMDERGSSPEVRLLKKKVKLSRSMTVTEFDNGYWYALELKDFAKTLGLPFANRLRKDELEECIKLFLETRKIEVPNKRSLSITGPKDVDLGLRLDLPVKLYTNDKATKDFLEREAQKIAPRLKRKSGVRYRHNRWREEQLSKGVRITYGDLVREYVRLNQTEGPFAQIPLDRYINFLSDFLKAQKGATREQAMKAWGELKTLDIPKNYRAWQTFHSSKENE